MKKVIMWIGVLTVFGLLVGLWLRASPGPATAQEPEKHRIFLPLVGKAPPLQNSTTIVRMSKAAYLQVSELIQPLLFIDYESFVWLGLNAAHLATLKESGVDFEPQQEAMLLFLNRFQFDPLEGEPQLPSEQQTTYAPGEEGFHLVQFFGPTKDEWLDGLRDDGAIVIQFQASHAYIVRMTPEEAALVDQEDFARWVGIYHAAYRIAPSLLDLEPPGPFGAQQIIENVDVTIYNDGQVDETIAAIKELGGQLIQQFPATPDGSLATAIFALASDAVVDVAQLNTVLWMNFSSPEPGFDDEVSDQIVVGNQVGGVPFTGYNAWLSAVGFNGTGVVVAVVDTGMDTNNNGTAHLDIRGRIAAFVSYPGAPATDTNGHGTHVGGAIAGNANLGTVDANGFLYGMGVAPNAQLVVQNALSGSAWPPAGGWQQLSRGSVINGAVASNNSWWTGSAGTPGYTGAERAHDFMVRDADFTTAAVAEPLIMVFSAGNGGPGASTITEPKEAKNLIAVGASENFRNDPWVAAARAALVSIGANPNACGNPININFMGGFSSRGLARDGRILPTITAPGSYIASLRSATGTYGIVATGGCSGIIDANYVWFSGTSQAAPHVTGGVALITQWWRTFNAGANPSPAMAKALLINGAVDMGAADIPNNNEGWGRMNLNNVINPLVPVIYRDQTTTFSASGQTWSLSVGPDDPSQPLKVTLVWSDAPGPGGGGATAARVNDLDLTAAQGATIFRGNAFAGGWSTPVGTADRNNNIENVYIQSPSGAYDITVTAFNIGGDGVPLNADSTDQDFALVCYNCVTDVADLSITKTDSRDPVAAGDEMTYTLQVTNNGPFDAAGVTLTDHLPAGVTFVSSTPGSPTCSQADGTVNCNLGDLPAGAMSEVTITVLVDADLVFNNGGPLVITNVASVESLVSDPDPSNNSVSEDTLVVAEADLEIVSFWAADPPAEILLGEPVDITLRKEITNHGPSAPMDVELTATAVASSGAAVTPPILVVSEPALDGLQPVEEDFTVSCSEPGLHTFTFANEIQPLNPEDTDPNLANNQAELILEIECVVPVIINIKPGSDPNSINPDSQDVIPVAILTTVAGEYGTPLDFDATMVDPLSVRFGPRDEVWAEIGGAFEAHGRGHIEDSKELDEFTMDGDMDMVLHFHVRETGIAAGDIEACVKGEWIDEGDDVHTFFGCDAVRTVPE